MGALDNLLAQSSRQERPSQVAAQEQKNSSGSALDNLTQTNGGKFVQPKPAAPTPQPKAQQPPQQTNYFQEAIKAITDTATKAINAIQGKGFNSPTQQQSTLGTQTQNTTVKPIQPINPSIKPDLNVSATAGSSGQLKNTPKSNSQTTQNIATFNRVTNVIDTFAKQYLPATRKQALDLNGDPFSLNADPTKVVNDAVNSIKDAVKEEAANINDYINAKTPSTVVGTYTKAVAGIGGVVFSPITALFNGANDLPLLGTLSKIITLPFTAVGEGATDASNAIIDKLPLSQTTKNNIKPGIGEILALASQIAVGKTTDIGAKITELTKKYGANDAETIASKAQELASNKQQAENNKPSNTVELTPQQARAQIQATDLKGTPAGDVLLKAANEAEAQGKSLQITTRPQEAPTARVTEQKLLVAKNPQNGSVQGEGFTVTNKVDKTNLATSKSIQDYNKALDSYNKKPTPTKLAIVQKLRQAVSENKAKGSYSAKTPQGNAFDINLVEPTVIKPVKTGGENLGALQEATQSPDLTTYEHAFNSGDIKTMDDLAAKNPGDTRFQVHKELSPETASTPSQSVTKPAPTTPASDIKSAPANEEGKTPSKIATSIERKAVEKKLTKGFEGIAGYDKITIKDQAEKATKVFENIDQARKIVRGEEPLPAGLRGTALITAAEEHIAKTGDAEMAHDLANSPLVSETSAAAQEMRLAAEREPDSLAARLQELKKAKQDGIVKRTGKTVSKATDDTVKEIKRTVPKQKKEDWSSFVQSIQC